MHRLVFLVCLLISSHCQILFSEGSKSTGMILNYSTGYGKKNTPESFTDRHTTTYPTTQGVSETTTLESYWSHFRNEDEQHKSSECVEACLNDTFPDTCPMTDNWLVQSDNNWDYEMSLRVFFSLFYIIVLCYLFVGVSIISDRFMASIEVITAKEKTIVVQSPTGEIIAMQTPVWNDTVANLTLMALGSSAPEICLAIVEVCADDFKAGVLGPGTVLGSAAFNFFCIIGLCITAIPKGEARKIEKFGVFCLTCFCSVFAYVWMLLILVVISPCVIEVWEAMVTLFYFPIMVIVAWQIDKRDTQKVSARMIHSRSELSSEMGSGLENKTASFALSEKETCLKKDSSAPDHNRSLSTLASLSRSTKISIFSKHWKEKLASTNLKVTNTRKQEFLEKFQTAKKENPQKSDEVLLDEIAQSMLQSSRKSKVYYRLMSLGINKEFTSPVGKRMRRTWHVPYPRPKSNVLYDDRTSKESAATADHLTNYFNIQFTPAEYVVMENAGKVTLYVSRLLNKANKGSNTKEADFTSEVDYKTVDGSAKANSDFVPKWGTIIFEPGDFIKSIDIEILNDDIYEGEEFFSVVLFNLVNHDPKNLSQTATNNRRSIGVESIETSGTGGLRSDSSGSGFPCVLFGKEARVVVLDEDHRGVFSFEKEEEEVDEKEQQLVLTVKRWKGARAVVDVPYTTDDFTARSGIDFIRTEGVLRFEDNETSHQIVVPIINTHQYEKCKMFHVRLNEPRTITTIAERLGGRVLTKEEQMIDLKGEATLGQKVSCLVTIVENKKLRHHIDGRSKRLTVADIIKSETYQSQFRSAIFLEGEQDEETGDIKELTNWDWFFHVLTFFWKVVFAMVPPPGMCGGWLCFVGSLIVIGSLTWLIEKVATNIGCAAGIMDLVTAISLVALGTSLPDTFASRAAAIADENADAAVGNVTGSNAVNVFLGIGLAWLLGAVVNNIRGCHFAVEPRGIGFSVLLFCALSCLGIGILLYRRFSQNVQAELGGPTNIKYITACLMLFLWLTYVTFASLAAYNVINPGL